MKGTTLSLDTLGWFIEDDGQSYWYEEGTEKGHFTREGLERQLKSFSLGFVKYYLSEDGKYIICNPDGVIRHLALSLNSYLLRTCTIFDWEGNEDCEGMYSFCTEGGMKILFRRADVDKALVKTDIAGKRLKLSEDGKTFMIEMNPPEWTSLFSMEADLHHDESPKVDPVD